ncbi:hypothetical protein Daesc_008554 [Daldinia eschscholtzii]|uniref:Zn(2)-C6 fungal-type domain-containing protein n=1 Tax=Daldinia eschscholtzii TaxID=292717 RepID=A0AAX6MC07_9PEZI
MRNPMSDNYKRLLPAPMPSGSAQGKAPEASFPKDTGPPIKKRTVSKAACNNCRLKKIRCDGKRPSCTACTKANVECNFVTASSDETPFMALKREVESLRRSTEDMLEIFDLLESAPDAVSLDILRRLKSTRNPAEGTNDTSDILASVKKDLEDEPLLPVKISNRQLMAGLIPETQQTTEYELMMRYPNAYPMLIPVEIAFINLADLLRPAILEQHRPHSKYASPVVGSVDTIPYKPAPHRFATALLMHVRSAGQGDTPSSSTAPGGPGDTATRTGILPTVLDASDREVGNFIPLQSMHTIIDDRLKGVNFQTWTPVPITNDLAATLLSLYLEIDYPWCPLFDADLFLNDCLQGKTHFCSALLVNALLGWACQSYSSLQPEATNFIVPFETEAESLWQVEKFTNTLTAAAAAQLLNSTSASRGRDDFANQCLDEGIQMGKRMGRKSTSGTYFVRQRRHLDTHVAVFLRTRRSKSLANLKRGSLWDGSFQVAELTILGLLSMALRNGFLSAPEANTILNNMSKIGQRYDAQFTVRASFMVDLELAMTNPREAQVQTLASAFHELAIYREFTTGEPR